MQLLPRGDDNVDIAVYSTGNYQRDITLYKLADGSLGVPLSRALQGATSIACEDILHASEAFNDGSLQKHTLSINVRTKLSLLRPFRYSQPCLDRVLWNLQYAKIRL